MTAPYAIRAKRAVGKVGQAVRKGTLVKQPCADCGDLNVQAHHPRGYDQGHELDVEWLCRPHHLDRHRGLRAKAPYRGSKPSWGRSPGFRAYMAATRSPLAPGASERFWQFGERSGPPHLLLTIRRVWSLLVTDEEREHAIRLVEELSGQRMQEAGRG